jgi:hypothetical protein
VSEPQSWEASDGFWEKYERYEIPKEARRGKKSDRNKKSI